MELQARRLDPGWSSAGGGGGGLGDGRHGVGAGGACKDGAIGGAVGEIVAQMFKPANGMFYTEAEKTTVLGYSKLVAGAVSAYAGGNAQMAITTAETAVKNNGLLELLSPRNLPQTKFTGKVNAGTESVEKTATIDTERQRITLIQPADKYLYAAGTGGPQVDGYTLIFVHAGEQSIQGVKPNNITEWNTFINMIKTSGAWKEGQSIILDACNTGMIDAGVASALAKSLNTKVIGASTTTWNIPSYSTAGVTGAYIKLTDSIPNLLAPGIWKTYGADGSLLSTTTKKPY